MVLWASMRAHVLYELFSKRILCNTRRISSITQNSAVVHCAFIVSFAGLVQWRKVTFIHIQETSLYIESHISLFPVRFVYECGQHFVMTAACHECKYTFTPASNATSMILHVECVTPFHAQNCNLSDANSARHGDIQKKKVRSCRKAIHVYDMK